MAVVVYFVPEVGIESVRRNRVQQGVPLAGVIAP